MSGPVLLIGGGASVGKTTLATSLACRLGARDVLEVDAVRRNRPEVLHLLDRDGFWDLELNALFGLLLEETRSVRPGLVSEIADRRSDDRPAIVEGEGIEPQIVGALPANERLRVAYIIESDRQTLWQTFASRSSRARFLRLTSEQQAAVVEMNRLYGFWLRDEAARAGHPWVESRPWATLPDRLLFAVGLL